MVMVTDASGLGSECYAKVTRTPREHVNSLELVGPRREELRSPLYRGGSSQAEAPAPWRGLGFSGDQKSPGKGSHNPPRGLRQGLLEVVPPHLAVATAAG